MHSVINAKNSGRAPTSRSFMFHRKVRLMKPKTLRGDRNAAENPYSFIPIRPNRLIRYSPQIPTTA